MATVRVLIADDHPIIRSGLREAIEGQRGKWLVFEASDGEQAVEYCRTHPIDVAIFDISMPKLDGLAAVRMTREQKPTLKVILLTMYDDPALLEEGLALGAQGYVLKDEPIVVVLEALRAVLKGERYLSPALQNRDRKRDTVLKPLPDSSPYLELLTVKERKILRLIGEHLTSKEIADRLQCSVHTINAHRQNLSIKLRLSGSHSLLKFAFENRDRL
ncbi:MAG: response regulator transcription factor [Verrucomicrobia bacterium]|jgi:DNA-binding NarL/FixJ family response regulator|nr:response regulator transcription factor [Verrucomicrobiota bacterium]OQC66268.1 MAG: Oxygen regulatory protein NreC [Verrucomicrobia bacterium ADurb.Bin006]MDI9380341.1 response regulator transcription factor [Verrucomicrobiota bacterium]NMD18776.1 response regulator transcription factor [Verrucomicrobiota bacterium]HNU99208.1 response regulator transcription factor [Verrucomicrobiota bacterium]